MTEDKPAKQAKPFKLDGVQLDPEVADGDRPETWGDKSLSESEASARYEADRPPHHGD